MIIWSIVYVNNKRNHDCNTFTVKSSIHFSYIYGNINTTNTEIPNTFGQFFQTRKHTQVFTIAKKKNSKLSIALKRYKGKATGLDHISNKMRKILPINTKRLVVLCKNIFNTHLPRVYKNSMTVFVLKLKSDKTITKSYSLIYR